MISFVDRVMTLRLERREPFAGGALLRFLCARAVPGVESCAGGAYRRTLHLPHGAGVVELTPADGHVRCRLRLDDARDIEEARTTALSFVDGHSAEELRRVGEEIFDEHIARRIWPGTRALAQMHIDAGQRVWLVTATPVELATTIARRLGLTGALGTVAEISAGRYTGRLVGEPLHGMAKTEAVRALAVREGLQLERCSAYSDSSNDIPLLSLVGHPCAVNPDAKLRAHAKAQGWRIRDYRTGRKAAKIGVPAAAGAGALAGGVLAAISLRRRLRSDRPLARR